MSLPVRVTTTSEHAVVTVYFEENKGPARIVAGNREVALRLAKQIYPAAFDLPEIHPIQGGLDGR